MPVYRRRQRGPDSKLPYDWASIMRIVRQSAGAGVRAIPGDASGQCPDRLGVRNTVPAEVDPGCHSLDAGSYINRICLWCHASGGPLLCESCGRETVAYYVHGDTDPVTGVRKKW